MTTSCHNNTMIAAAVNSHHGVVECADTFPFKLYDMLQAAETYNFDDVVSWGPHGQAFKVHDSRAFAQRILPKYFSGQSRYKSFLRQLNFYKFKRATEGPDKGKDTALESRVHFLFFTSFSFTHMHILTKNILPPPVLVLQVLTHTRCSNVARGIYANFSRDNAVGGQRKIHRLPALERATRVRHRHRKQYC